MIVPGSIFSLNGTPINHQFSWYAVVKEKTSGKQWTYWFNGNQINREIVAAYIADRFRNVEVVTIDPCTSMPTRMLQPVPAEHFQFGVFKAMEEYDHPCKLKALPRNPIRRNSVRQPARA